MKCGWRLILVNRKKLGCGVCMYHNLASPPKNLQTKKRGKTKVMLFKDGKIFKNGFGVSAFIEPKATLFRLTKN